MGLGAEGLLFLSFTMGILLQDGSRHSLRLNLEKTCGNALHYLWSEVGAGKTLPTGMMARA